MAGWGKARDKGTPLAHDTTDESVPMDPAPEPSGPDRSRRRRLLMRGGIAVLAILVLVIVPGYIATRPAFFGRSPALAEKYVPWSTSTHVEAGCEGCHVKPGVLPQVLYRTRMVGEFYLSLVNRSREPKVFARPTNESCLACHSDLRTVSPKGDLQIPHRAHVSILKMECVECHDYLVHELSPEGKHTPPMSGCLTCHNGDTAKDSCTACHTEKAAPESHQAADWGVVHAERANDPDCQSCHKWTEDWCADCHARKPASHGDDWRAVHGERVKQHRGCEACHAADFCIRCHGEVPDDNFDPALKIVE